MDELEQSLRYVPTYQIVEQIRKEERKIARDKLAIEKDKIKMAQEKTKEAREKSKIEKERREKLELAIATALLDKGVSIESIAKIMEITPNAVEKILNIKS